MISHSDMEYECESGTWTYGDPEEFTWEEDLWGRLSEWEWKEPPKPPSLFEQAQGVLRRNPNLFKKK